MVSGLQPENTEMKRYSTTLDYGGNNYSLVAYLLHGDNLPSACSLSTPPSLFKKGRLEEKNELMQAGGTHQLTKKPPALSSSATEHLKRALEALAVELGVDVPILLSTITEVFGGESGNMVPGKPLENRPLSTRCVSSDSA